MEFKPETRTNITRTRGNIIVEDIKIGDIHYEFDYGFYIKSEVVSAPAIVDGIWEWKSKNTLHEGDIYI
jgi:hypothetical protein